MTEHNRENFGFPFGSGSRPSAEERERSDRVLGALFDPSPPSMPEGVTDSLAEERERSNRVLGAIFDPSPPSMPEGVTIPSAERDELVDSIPLDGNGASSVGQRLETGDLDLQSEDLDVDLPEIVESVRQNDMVERQNLASMFGTEVSDSFSDFDAGDMGISTSGASEGLSGMNAETSPLDRLRDIADAGDSYQAGDEGIDYA